MTPVAILSPGYPSIPGGVTDHTARVVRHWEETGHQVSVIGDCNRSPRSVAADLLKAKVRGLLIQYVPFLYGRRGLSRYPQQVAEAARAAGIHVTTFVHETWVPANRLAWLVLSPLQKRQLIRLLAVSDSAVTPVPKWRSMLGDKAQVLYVGCVLAPGPEPGEHGSVFESPAVFSPFAAGLNWEWISAAETALDAGPGLTIVGGTTEQAASHDLVGKYYRPTWNCLGRLPGPEVLASLAGAKLTFAPFIDGATGRRGSIGAPLSVGTTVLSSTGHLFDSAFEGPVEIARSLEEYVERARQLWNEPADESKRAGRLRWFADNLDGEKLDARLLRIVTAGGD